MNSVSGALLHILKEPCKGVVSFIGEEIKAELAQSHN